MKTEGGINMNTSELMQKEIDRVKENQSQLYSLDRENKKSISAIESDIAEVKTDNKHYKEDMAEVKQDITEMKSDIADLNTKVTNVDQKVDRLEQKFDVTDKKVDQVKNEVVAEIKTLKEDMNHNKWQPKDYCVVIVAVLSLLGTLLTAIITK